MLEGIDEVMSVDATHRIKIVRDYDGNKRYVPQYCVPKKYPTYTLETWINYRPGDMQQVQDAFWEIEKPDDPR